MNNKLQFLSFVMILHFFLPDPSAAYNDDITHRELTDSIVKNNSTLKNYLKDYLIIPEDITKTLKGHRKEQSILKWLQDGSEMEDYPNCRASNHFHNPIPNPTTTPWEDSGLSDTYWVTSAMCSFGDYPFGSLTSNLTWATGFTAADQVTQSPTGNNWDWNTARKFFYAALTGNSTELDGLKIIEGKWLWDQTTISGKTGLSESERDKFFAWTFRAVGNVLHMLQDGSVPAHVRNDFLSHRTFHGFIGWSYKDWFGNPFEHYVKHHNDIIGTIAPQEPNFQNPRLTDYWDSDGQLNEGITEYVNRTFFSTATISNNNPEPQHYFDEPSLSQATHNICVDSVPGKSDEKRKYISRIPCPTPGTGPVDHFAAVSLRVKESEIIPANIDSIMLELDDNVFDDYAREILPNTLGYSIELLNYFFRGDISIENTNIDGQYIIKNDSDEDMTGTFELYYDDKEGARHFITRWADLTINANDVSEPVVFDLNGFFESPDNPEPKDAGIYMLVFKGTLGNETGAVAGAVVTIDRIWSEEWDNGLNGNHSWLYTGIDIPECPGGVYVNGIYIWCQNESDTGEILNIVTTEGVLVKENTRYEASSDIVQVNENLFSSTYIPDEELPWRITANSTIHLKIDEMSLIPNIPYQDCSIYNNRDVAMNGNAGEQFVNFTIEDGGGMAIDLIFTAPEHEPQCRRIYGGGTCLPPIYITEGNEITFNIYDELTKNNITVVEPISLISVDVTQQLASLCSTYPAQTQKMLIDYLRIVDSVNNGTP